MSNFNKSLKNFYQKICNNSYLQWSWIYFIKDLKLIFLYHILPFILMGIIFIFSTYSRTLSSESHWIFLIILSFIYQILIYFYRQYKIIKIINNIKQSNPLKFYQIIILIFVIPSLIISFFNLILSLPYGFIGLIFNLDIIILIYILLKKNNIIEE